MITTAQIKAARALIGWRQADLARAAKLSPTSLNDIERGEAKPRVATVARIKAALESAGVRFTSAGGVEPAEGEEPERLAA